MLLYNVALEHSAIVQYLYHIFLIRDPEIKGEIEEIAREEMRHMKWFAQKVVELGGKVLLERREEEIRVGGPDWKSMIENDINAEEKAIKVYTEQFEIVKDDSVKKLLERVINDEMTHKNEFSEILEHVKDLKPEEEKKEADKKTIEILNKLLNEEYRIILDYLHNFFHSKNCAYKDIMLDLAIESMVHMGKLGEKIGELGCTPDLKLPSLEGTKCVEKHILYEQLSKDEYLKKLKEIKDPSVRKILEKIEKQEEYHKQKLIEFMKKMHRFTVGDLKEES